MSKEKNKRVVRSVVRWIFWVLLVQFVLINVSAAFYAHKFTRLYSSEQKAEDWKTPPSDNFFPKTWRLFSGSRFYKYPESQAPDSSYVTVNLLTEKNIPVEAWYCRVDSSKGTVILFHGLMGNKSYILRQAAEFHYRGYNVMLTDVRGHGNSGGQTTTIGFREAEEVKLAYDYVRQQGEKNVFIWGFSMGAVEVIKAVADYKLEPAGIILETPYGSLQDHIKARMHTIGFPRQPFGFLVTFWIGVERGFNGLGFRLDKYAKKIKCPALLQYGGNDQLVARSEVDAIYNAFASAHKKLAIYENAGHASLLQNDPVRWRKETEEFMESKK
jgi:alpha-beta hydrolase superfamily lysophospholipase